MNKTSIEWVKNPDGSQGYTWNPITGCLNGCPYCYARKLANGRLNKKYLANPNYSPIGLPSYSEVMNGVDMSPYLDQIEKRNKDPFYPRFWPPRVRENFGACTAGAEPKGIFVCDMGDLFGIGIPEDWTRRILSHIDMSWYKEHRFYLLTKQPQNLPKFSPFPENCWVGVTVTNAEYMADAVANLACIEAKIRFMSFEPLLGSVMPKGLIDFLDWLIIGAQTKPYRPPEKESVQEIVSAADHAGIPVFLKDNLSPIAGDPRHNFNLYNHFEPMNPVLRQEMPK